MKKINDLQFHDCLDTTFLLFEETRGEDSYCCVHKPDSSLISVFDGCGGLGAQRYRVYQKHTGAYMASRLISGAIYNWYQDHHSKEWGSPEDLLASLCKYFNEAYSIATSRADSNISLGGSLLRDFPTTAAIALAQQAADGIKLHIIWAGDSRVYLMDESGLAQLTLDDAEDIDAFSNLYNDGALTNLLSSDGDYTLHYKTFVISKPTVIFAATDGCFDYFHSPMEFEYALLHALEQAGSVDVFKELLRSCFSEITGDDFSLAFMSYFYGTFDNLKSAFADRLSFLREEYIKPLENNRDKEYLKDLWGKYRSNYERHL